MAAGRHRTFDTVQALEAAMLVFWKNGYPGTSMADLTQAMAINKPSLYAAFGNKEQLYMAALEQYMRQQSSPIIERLFALDQTLEERLYAYLQAVAQQYTDPNLPAGCMMVNSMCESTGDGVPASAHSLITNMNRSAKRHFIDFFTNEQEQGTLKSQSSPLAQALYLMSITSGMAVLARDGTTLSELDELIEHVVETII